jgi:cell division protein FtsZ
MAITQQSTKQKTERQGSTDWKACLVTVQHTVEDILKKHLGHDRLRVKHKLSDLTGERDCSLYIVDTRIPDISIWPAPILVDPANRSKPWIFLLSKTSDASSLSELPTNSMFFEHSSEGLDALTSFIKRMFSPELSKKIERVYYVENIGSFVVRMGNGKTYLLKMDDLPEADSSRVIQYRIARNHDYFKVRQESSNWFEVPWDEVLYHCEPGYEYYKGKQVQTANKVRARRIGEKLREIRNTKGLSVEELAQKAGLKRPNLSRLEHGKHVPSLETMERLSVALGVPVADIVAGPSEIKQALPDRSKPNLGRIRVIGLGGAGCNAITRMVREQIRGVEFIAMNTDAQHLAITEAAIHIQLGERVTRGLGASGDRALGRKAAEESRDEIKQVMSSSDMTFIIAGMGGGTGTGAAPMVAEISRQCGALTIAIVTKPFGFEGNRRMRTAEEGIMELMDKVDTLVIIPNDRLLDLFDQKTGVEGAFKMADELLYHGVQAIAEVVTVPGLINLDFADIRTIMKDAGPAWMSIGRGSGQNRAVDAAKQALASPLLDVSIEEAKGVLLNIAGSTSLTLFEVNSAAEVIRQAVDPEANVIFGVVLDPNMGNEVRLTLIATGFTTKEAFAGSARQKEIARLLRTFKDKEPTIPSSLSRSLYSSRREMPA